MEKITVTLLTISDLKYKLTIDVAEEAVENFIYSRFKLSYYSKNTGVEFVEYNFSKHDLIRISAAPVWIKERIVNECKFLENEYTTTITDIPKFRNMEEVLKSKFDHYGITQAAIEFAMREYAEQYALHFIQHAFDRKFTNEQKSKQLLLNEFKVKYNT